MSTNTIEYGISQVHYSIVTYDQETNESTYSKPKPIKGTTTLSLDVVGDSTTIFADNIAYFVATSNQGYSGTLTIIQPTNAFLTEVYDLITDTNKANIEYSDKQIKEIALGFQVEGDQEKRRIWLYRVSTGRPVQEHRTKAETLEADTYSIALKAMPRQDDNVVKAFVYEQDSPEQYQNWFDDVYKIENKKKQISEIIKVVDLSGENVPVASNDDKPVGGQIANAVIAKNKEATINDFNIADDSVIVTKKPVDGDPYQYGTYTAILTGAGNYDGTLDINGTFGRLNP